MYSKVLAPLVATLLDVVNHYNTFLDLKLSDQDKTDIVEFLRSL